MLNFNWIYHSVIKMSDVSPSTDELLKALLWFHELSDGKRIESLTGINLTDFLFEVSDDLNIKLELFNCLQNSFIANEANTLTLVCTCTRNSEVEHDWN